MFFDTTPDLPNAECGHSYTGTMLTSYEFLNNGIEDVNGLYEYPDRGFGAITDRRSDNGKFKVPNLRSIALTVPYMHDGRFETLEEVLDHYDKGGHNLSQEEDNASNFIRLLGLSQIPKDQTIQFLHTLTDTTFVKMPGLDNPFE